MSSCLLQRNARRHACSHHMGNDASIRIALKDLLSSDSITSCIYHEPRKKSTSSRLTFKSIMPVCSAKYCIKFSLGDKKNYLVTSDQVPTTNQRNYSTEVQLGEPLCLIGLKWPECEQPKGKYTAKEKPPCVPIIICCLNILGEWKGLMSSSYLHEKMLMGQIWQIYCG